MKKFLAFLVLLAALYYGFTHPGLLRSMREHVTGLEWAPQDQDRLAMAFANRESDVQAKGKGQVIRLLPDDMKGSRHQRFILRLASGQTLLIAHNIDLAPRIHGLKLGDEVGFFGEYEWNAKGGVLHWTHRDPRGRHVGGWLWHGGLLYE
jgi:hypothetical protein